MKNRTKRSFFASGWELLYEISYKTFCRDCDNGVQGSRKCRFIVRTPLPRFSSIFQQKGPKTASWLAFLGEKSTKRPWRGLPNISGALRNGCPGDEHIGRKHRNQCRKP
jgi:hypothetical protein